MQVCRNPAQWTPTQAVVGISAIVAFPGHCSVSGQPYRSDLRRWILSWFRAWRRQRVDLAVEAGEAETAFDCEIPSLLN